MYCAIQVICNVTYIEALPYVREVLNILRLYFISTFSISMQTYEIHLLAIAVTQMCFHLEQRCAALQVIVSAVGGLWPADNAAGSTAGLHTCHELRWLQHVRPQGYCVVLDVLPVLKGNVCCLFTGGSNNTWIVKQTYPLVLGMLPVIQRNFISKGFNPYPANVDNMALLFVTIFMHGTYNYIPETNDVSTVRIQCCSCSVFTVRATCNVISHVKCRVFTNEWCSFRS